jgi:hypothetical protein
MNQLFKNIKTFKEVREDSTPEPTAIVSNGILLDNTLLTIVGSPKIGKTFLIYDLALAIASGGTFLESDVTEPKSVLILSAEGGYFPNRKRIKLLTRGMEDDILQKITYVPSVSLDLGESEHLDAIIEFVKTGGFQVLILDPFIRFHTTDENSASAMSTIYSNIHQIMDKTKVSVCLVHHTGKNEYAGARGSTVIASEYDSCITLKHSGGGVKATFDMRHVETPNPILLKFNSDTLRFEVTTRDPQQEAKISKVAEVLTEPMSKVQIVEQLKQTGISKSPAYSVLNQMEASGQIINQNGKLILSDIMKQ